MGESARNASSAANACSSPCSIRCGATAAVGSQRIEQGLEQALAADEAFLADSPMSALRYRHVPWLNS
ncbi:hypothetical protein QCD79_32725, partial [Pseudomonas quasicaspiana]|nr:hypothetical protein [Pseudomonas quasicaspiana]